jgi:site-specific recombinase XerD
METKWVKRWDTWIAPAPVKPGVFRRKEGGFLVRGRVTDPRTGKMKEIRLNLKRVDALHAYNRLQDEIGRVRDGLTVTAAPQRMLFTEYAASLFEHKLKTGRIKSAKSREKWEYVIRLHLAPVFGELFIDAIRRTDIKEWKETMGEMIQAGELHPGTANDRLAMLGRILGAAADEFEWERNPMSGIDRFDTSEHPTYTEEEPNSLTVEEVRSFLAAMKDMFPQHFAMTALGFATGLRPSTLRPLRRHGELADVKWDENVLLVRRSQTVGDEVMETTKTKKRQKLFLPKELMDVLRWHVQQQIPEHIQAKSDLLFPSETGGFRSGSVLSKPFRDVAAAIKLGRGVTPRGMRRTYQDLARAAEMKDLVTRAISGHATEQMQQHYSTVAQTEMREGIAKIISLAGVREAMGAGGMEVVRMGPKNESGQLGTASQLADSA